MLQINGKVHRPSFALHVLAHDGAQGKQNRRASSHCSLYLANSSVPMYMLLYISFIKSTKV